LPALLAISLSVTCALCVLLGFYLYVGSRASAVRYAETLHRITAVATTPAFQAGVGVTIATVDWTDAAGRHAAQASVPSATGAGDHVAIWVDRNDVPQTAPTAAGQSAGTAAAYAAAIFAGSATLLAGAHAWARHAMNKRVDRSWEEEWALVEPRWSRWNRQG
jgi:hypothetical protein